MNGQTRLLVIEAKCKAQDVGYVSPHDFKVRDGGPIDPQILLHNPNISLYCLDFDNRQALFVETPPECDLASAPFLYQTQYQAAIRLIQTPYETLHRLAQEVEIDPSRLIFLYSIGRCGSTLVSRAFHMVAGIETLSEPDVFSQLTTTSPEDAEGSEQAALLKSCVLLQCAPGRNKDATAWALKFRSRVIALGPTLYTAFPEAKVVFLYRSAEPWLRSAWRSVQVCYPSLAAGGLSKQLPALRGRTMLESLASQWLSMMLKCHQMQQQGIPMFLARYEELNAAPQDVLGQMFAHCGLPEPAVGDLDSVLVQDAQEGTPVSRTRLGEASSEVTAEQVEELSRLIQVARPSDTILRGTYIPAKREECPRHTGGFGVGETDGSGPAVTTP